LGVAGRTRWNWIRGHPLAELGLAQRGVDDAAARLGRDDPLWPGQLSIFAALVLYLLLPPKLSIGPRWLVPAAEGVLLAGLAYAARQRGPANMRRRAIALVLLCAVTVANMVALGLLTHYLIAGGRAKGADLIDGGVVIWLTNLVLFTVWYWEVDRGGPRPRGQEMPAVAPDFLFPQMSDKEFAPRGWRPGFVDYLYVSLTNQTAFSPTDTMPLSLRAKVLMGVQGTASLVTVGIIVARAVNTLS
jgi:hypothetical protein